MIVEWLVEGVSLVKNSLSQVVKSHTMFVMFMAAMIYYIVGRKGLCGLQRLNFGIFHFGAKI
jgi:hypothetical protein